MSTSEQFTLSEAASLLSGETMDSTTALPEKGVPSFVMTDGSNGLARNLPNFAGKVAATCYPTLSAMAATWNRELVQTVARAIALDARAAGTGALLAPGMNLKRSPLGGRNFEYFSEDATLTGALATAFVTGVQSVGIAACPKHFAVNNQETERMRISADVDERALREVYLRAFEQVVTTARPWMVMASYNRINGVYASENRWLLTDVLRDSWGFDGVVLSDWGAVDDRVAALEAGLDLEMPSTGGATDALVIDAVGVGRIREDAVLAASSRIATLARRVASAPAVVPLDPIEADALALRAAEQAAVLLRNERDVLPLAPDSSIAIIGAFARAPRFQGGGSADVNALRSPESLVDVLRAQRSGEVSFAEGYDDSGIRTSPQLLAEAVDTAVAADTVIVVVGLPDDAESEGFDRTHLSLPSAQEAVISQVSATGRPTVVVVVSGGVVTMERWRDRVDGILFTGLAGQAVTRATARLLVGAVSPSGRLAETIPCALPDSPSHPTFPGENGRSVYGESIFVGYRGYDEQGRKVAFPFGHGLTYSTFEHGTPRLTRDGDEWRCEMGVRNTGTVRAREVVQIYVSVPTSAARRAARELVGFDTVELDAGGSATIDLRVPLTALQRWAPGVGWVLDPGDYTFWFSRSSRDHIGSVVVPVAGDAPSEKLTPDSTMSEWLSHAVAGPRLLELVSELDTVGNTVGLLSDPTARLMIGGLPIKRLAIDASNVLSLDILHEIGESLSG